MGIRTNNNNQRMLLDGKRARIEIEREPAQWYSPAGKFFPSSADRENEELGNYIANREGWLIMSVFLCGNKRGRAEFE